jgi:hypothetical protein
VSQPGGGDGTLAFVVWPTHAGAVNARGEEPMGHRDYERGQIFWSMNEQGRLVGRVRILVPPGNQDWTHIIYTHNPTKPGFITASKLAQPFQLPDGGTIELIDITDVDVQPLTPDKVLHD